MARLNVLQYFTITLMFSTLIFQSEGKMMGSRKLDETTTTPPDLENKCGGCPCNNPCYNPPSSPPPPSLPPPPPPPPKMKPPPSNYCPPPPSGGQYPPNPSGGGQYPPSPPYMYINGPPGNLYPIDSYYSGSGRSFCVGSSPFLVSIVFGLLAFY